MNKLIGIISYLPNNPDIRFTRVEKLTTLINSCNEIFDLPILIIAQNWDASLISKIAGIKNIKLEFYPKLGIVGARNQLRKSFLNSNYDYLIMLDDDCVLNGTKEDGLKYKDQLDNNPNMYYEFNKSLLKLFAIHRSIFEKVSFNPNVNPESGEGFEDRLFYNTLLKKYPDNHFKFNVDNLKCTSKSTKDENSTWYTNQNIKEMLEKTFNLIDHIN